MPSLLRLDDSHMAQAYDATPAHLRARLKSAIALQFHLFQEKDSRTVQKRESSFSGFCSEREDYAAPWVIALLPSCHRAPARLLAFLLPAVLAGVRNIFVLCPDSPPSVRDTLALELAGLEHIFVASRATLSRPELLLQALPLEPDLEQPADGPGRVLLFPGSEPEQDGQNMALWRDYARKAHIPLAEDRPAPVLKVQGRTQSREMEERMDILRWCHEDAILSSGMTTDDSGPNTIPNAVPDACYPAGPDASSFHPACPLRLGPGLEGCWAAQGMTTFFFRNQRLTLSTGDSGEK